MPLNYGAGNPPPFSPPPPQQYNAPGFPPQSPASPYGGQAQSQASSSIYGSPYTPGTSSQSPYIATTNQPTGTPPSTGKQPGKPIPDWMVCAMYAMFISWLFY